MPPIYPFHINTRVFDLSYVMFPVANLFHLYIYIILKWNTKLIVLFFTILHNITGKVDVLFGVVSIFGGIIGNEHFQFKSCRNHSNNNKQHTIYLTFLTSILKLNFTVFISEYFLFLIPCFIRNSFIQIWKKLLLTWK